MKHNQQMRFPHPLKMQETSNPNEFMLLDHLWYRDDTGVFHIVPHGFVYDGATIPRILWPFLGHPFAEFRKSAAFHDYHYAHGDITRKQADRLLRQMMRDEGVAHWKRWVIYAGVRLFGWTHWKKGR